MAISPEDSLLARSCDWQVSATPFPHLVIHDPIRPDLYQELLDHYPPVETLTLGKHPGSNLRFSYSARSILTNPRIASVWRAFVELHISPGFWRQVLALFQREISGRYSALLDQRGGIQNWRTGVRKVHTFEEVDLLLDAQICVNTPVLGARCSVRTPHVDQPNKLFAGLFYLRPPGDESVGGDLEIFRFRGAPGGFRGVYVDDRHIECTRTIRYDSNVLVLFLNSERAVHGVTARSQTATPRWFLNLVGEVPRPLFDLTPYQMRLSEPSTHPEVTLEAD